MTEQTNYSSTLGNVTTVSATSREQIVANLRASAARNFKNIYETSFYGIEKGDMAVAIVGGGPSLKNHLNELRDFNGLIWACGSVHDYLIDNGIIPHHCIVCDPDAIAANYVRKPNGGTLYYIASQCDPEIFKQLRANGVVLWHCFNNNREDLEATFPGFKAFGGGCTVGLRALTLAIAMKFSNIHLFGFDSCLDNDTTHAYKLNSNEELGEIFDVCLDTENGRVYKAVGYQLAQLQHFNEFYRMYGDKFNVSFHGTGLLPDLFSRIKAEAEKLAKEKVNEPSGN